MKDSGFVVSARTDLAEVEVRCLVDACNHCSAKSLCSSGRPSKGRLMVRNPLHASVGDEVEIEIPENLYNRALIIIFSTLLLGSLLGILIGYLATAFLPLDSQQLIIIGFGIALFASVVGLAFYFRRKNRFFLYPVITNILHKGDHHG
jgi:positive regulator of sigma E activity